MSGQARPNKISIKNDSVISTTGIYSEATGCSIKIAKKRLKNSMKNPEDSSSIVLKQSPKNMKQSKDQKSKSSLNANGKKVVKSLQNKTTPISGPTHLEKNNTKLSMIKKQDSNPSKDLFCEKNDHKNHGTGALESNVAAMPDHSPEAAVTFSPDSSPEHEFNDFNPFSGPRISGGRDASVIGLNEGTFHNVMKFIEESDDEGISYGNTGKNLPDLNDKKENLSSSVEKSQVDGGFDSLSSVSYSPEPTRFSLDEASPFPSCKTFTNLPECPTKARDLVPMNVIQKRIKQANKTKDKPALLKHVFSTYTKRRKIVIVRYKKAEHKIYDMEEYTARSLCGALDESYDEDDDEICVRETPSKIKKARSNETPPPKLSPIKPGSSMMAERKDQATALLLEAQNLELEVNLDCHICKRTFPNRIRLLAHFQMHSDDDAKKKRKKSLDIESRDELDDDLMSLKIDQVDGATDIIEPSTSSSSNNGGNESSTIVSHPNTQFLILRRDNEEVSGGEAGVLANQFVTVIRGPQSSSIASAPMLSNQEPILSNGGNFMFNQSLSTGMESTASTSAGSLGSSLISLPLDPLPLSTQHPLLMKQDPVLMATDFIKEEDEDAQEDNNSHSDFMLDESLQLFESHHSSLIDSSDSAIQLSLDDIASFAQPMVDATNEGSHTSFDTSIETSSFLSGTESHPLEDILSETTTNRATPVSLPESFPQTESRTPSIPDDGEFPCPQCDKKFGNRRNLLSHTRRHTGDFKLFCDDCGKGFFTQSKLDSHKRKHTGTFKAIIFGILYNITIKYLGHL